MEFVKGRAQRERRVTMENQSKQRIIGAIVMVIVLAVFLFFLLHNQVAPSEPQAFKSIPKIEPQKTSEISFELPLTSTPAPKMPVLQATSSTLPSSSSAIKNPVITPASTPVPPQKIAAPIITSSPSQPSVLVSPHSPVSIQKTKSPSASSLLPLSQASVAPPVSTPIPQQKVVTSASVIPVRSMSFTRRHEAPELQALQLMGPPQAWVLQLGLFSSMSNANHLVSRLRANGFDVYTRIIKGSYGRESVRVFVGPNIHRADIETIGSRLAQNFHLHGIIRKYQL